MEGHLTSDARDADPFNELTMHLVESHIAVVTLNRPRVRNALSAKMAHQLAEFALAIDANPQIRVAILTGTGDKAFCSGADLNSAQSAGDVQNFIAATATFLFEQRRKPWIAALNGTALGAGAELMMACDLAVASENAVIGLPEVRRGVLAGGGGVFRLPRALPRAVALEMIATGEPLTAKRALELNLLNRVVPADRVFTEATALARTICANAPLAVQESMRIARQALDLSELELRELASQALIRLQSTQDYLEGPSAFLQKRQPVWRGC
jgi:enoyl-CoA hydratase/carnithine racemase